MKNKIKSLISVVKESKIGKIGLIVISFASFGFLFTWEFSLVLLIIIFIHESGHIWAMKRCGMKTKGIYFLPLLGGMVDTDGKFPSRIAEIFVFIMGPLWGLFLASLTCFAYIATGNLSFATAASWIITLNMFNLLPVGPLDGGGVTKSIAYSAARFPFNFVILIMGIIISGLIAISVNIMFFVFLLVFGGLDFISEFKLRKHVNKEYPAMKGGEILGSVAVYIGIIVAFLMLMDNLQKIPGVLAAADLLKGYRILLMFR